MLSAQIGDERALRLIRELTLKRAAEVVAEAERTVALERSNASKVKPAGDVLPKL
jgi:hypothetical protein